MYKAFGMSVFCGTLILCAASGLESLDDSFLLLVFKIYVGFVFKERGVPWLMNTWKAMNSYR